MVFEYDIVNLSFEYDINLLNEYGLNLLFEYDTIIIPSGICYITNEIGILNHIY